MRTSVLALVLIGCGPLRGTSPYGDVRQDRRGEIDPGDLLITEVMADPDACSDATGEWFELHNASRDPLAVDGLRLVDASGDVGTVRSADVLAPGGSVVVGRGDAESFCGPDAGAYFSGLSMNNGGESLTLLHGDVVIDSTPAFSGSEIRAGISLQLHPSFVWGAFDTTAWFRADQCVNGGQNTPGEPNTDCVTEGMTERFTVVDSPTPVTEEQKHAILAAENAWLDGTAHSVGYQPLIRTGQALGGLPFGTLTGEDGMPLQAADGSQFVSTYADFTSVVDRGDDGLWAITHFEEHPGAMYLTELSEVDGALAAVSTQPVDFSSIGGLWTPCAGSITPWGTHLGSEEYPSDGREFLDVATTSDLDNRAFEYIRYYGFDIFTDADDDGEPDHAPLDAVLERFNPYRHGFAVEVSVGAGGSTTVERHYAMGRRSLELAKVMPDARTVYLTDDGTNVGLYMFVADTAGDLSAGHLYAMRWDQTLSNPPTADVTWVDLGWANNEVVKSAVDAGIGFDDLFSMADPVDGDCPEGFRGVNIGEGHECLSVKPGQEAIASRLESRRYAGYMGATTELRKEEGLAHDPESNTLFVSLSAIESGMSDRYRDYDTGGPNHVRLAYNPCGAVFALPLGPDEHIDSGFVATEMRAVVQGRPATYEEGSPYHRNHCNVNSIASPDNLTFLPGRNTLIIGEDTSRHINDAVWAMDLNTGRLDRLMTTPYGAEATSVDWHEDLRGRSLMVAVAQHPYGESDRSKLQDPADAAAWVGYYGPFWR